MRYQYLYLWLFVNTCAHRLHWTQLFICVVSNLLRPGLALCCNSPNVRGIFLDANVQIARLETKKTAVTENHELPPVSQNEKEAQGSAKRKGVAQQ